MHDHASHWSQNLDPPTIAVIKFCLGSKTMVELVIYNEALLPARLGQVLQVAMFKAAVVRPVNPALASCSPHATALACRPISYSCPVPTSQRLPRIGWLTMQAKSLAVGCSPPAVPCQAIAVPAELAGPSGKAVPVQETTPCCQCCPGLQGHHLFTTFQNTAGLRWITDLRICATLT